MSANQAHDPAQSSALIKSADDERLIDRFAAEAAGIPGVIAVTLGGSRAVGTDHRDSDFDFAIYHRRRLDPADVRAVGWPGEVFAPGEWGGGVMNGGAFLEVEGRRVDLHYRDLDSVERCCAQAEAGHFNVERLPFYLAGIPTYVVMAELAIARVLVGELPRPSYPPALRDAAPPFWRGAAQLSLAGARGYAEREQLPECVASLTRALIEEAHARAAERAEWVLNEKRLIDAAGLGAVRPAFELLSAAADRLAALCAEVERAIARR
ncbi:MAG: nucleotidyltransferase domain-containing protein [Chloroflexota bacterium]|nr:nucleotidyltransferase domain-containing protein [Chloroflexota bacterium]